ncbi:uncharacterized protein LOC142236012 [Haematobia irritans]|uniref:uncharacterized protein LOC142236012 n=1 Tax=Haematobia irritans TaxID=7368 RepID=UPI003F506371
MWRYSILLLLSICGYCLAGPVGLKKNIPIGLQQRNNDAASTMESTQAESSGNAAAEDPSSAEIMIMSSLTLPSNATSIRSDITDNFSCANKTYGYYADVDNDCQIFHVCLPVTYADGKENTFRWSFICPEETVFSQESFTCMRPEDMTISCEDSLSYYELNRNFGMVDSETEKETNEAPVEAEKETVAIQPEVEAPIVPAPEKPLENASKVQKPNRRKPTVSYATQNKPLRKNTQSQSEMNGIHADQKIVETNVDKLKPVGQENDIKPAIQKFNRRPVPVMPNSFKTKVQDLQQNDVNSLRSDLFNQKRKRPTMFNRKPEDSDKKTEEPNTSETQEIKTPEQNFSQMESEVSNSNTVSQMADSEVESSQTQEVYVKPEATPNAMEEETPVETPLKSESVMDEKSPQVLEAFEEIPAVISEIMEIPESEEKKPEDQTVMEEEISNMEKVGANANVDENRSSSEHLMVQESTVDEKQEETELESQKVEESVNESAEKTSIVEDMQPMAEDTKPMGENMQPMAEDMKPMVEEVPLKLQTSSAQDTNTEMQTQQEVMKAEDIQNADETSQMAQESQMSEEVHNSDEMKVSEVETPDVNMNEGQHQNADETSQMAQESQMSEEVHNSEETKDSEVETPEVTMNEIQTEVAIENTDKNIDSESVVESEATSEVDGNQNLDTELEESTKLNESEMTIPNEEEGVSGENIQTLATDVSTAAEEIEETKSDLPSVDETEVQQTNIVNSEPTMLDAANVEPIQTIAEMEAEKPAEAPESMPATDEMSQPDPMVQEMLEETNEDDSKKQTIGGFKPVDPVMAAEAEQLIADFINTLRKNDFTNEKPGMLGMQMPINPDGEETVREEAKESMEGIKNEDSQPNIFETPGEGEEDKTVEMSEDTMKTQDEIQTQTMDSAETLNEMNSLKSIENNVDAQQPIMVPVSVPDMIMSHMPMQDTYEIPVQVISTSGDESMPEMIQPEEQQPMSDSTPVEMPSGNVEAQQEMDNSAMFTAGGYKPLSIDDIVELVKERLDQKPIDEMETPMQLDQVLNEAIPTEANEATKTQETIDEQSQPEVQESQEDIVMPIYHRMNEPLKVDAEVQTDSQGDSAVASEAAMLVVDPTSTQEKSNRSYRSRSMLSAKLDPRKRRFLFRSDES